MVSAARDGKLAEFEAQFSREIGQRVASRIDDMKQEIGHSIKVDGEIVQGD
ncbi:hypothetical protein NVP1081O_006 [Vibrio phage 1.081.O._10N.286.52.C2]|nr:hypothetical protein NVP1081O_006 [Vibrio phage 1.081.O._10N.286.52.C2]